METAPLYPGPRTSSSTTAGWAITYRQHKPPRGRFSLFSYRLEDAPTTPEWWICALKTCLLANDPAEVPAQSDALWQPGA